MTKEDITETIEKICDIFHEIMLCLFRGMNMQVKNAEAAEGKRTYEELREEVINQYAGQ